MDVNAAIDAAVNLIVQFEGFSATPYRDVAGIPTIGFGQTTLEDGSPVLMTTPPISRDDALWWVRDRVASVYMATVRQCVHVPLTVNQAAALCSLCYNIGPANLRGSTLVVDLNAGDMAAAADQFLVWNKVRDPHTHILTISRGLSARRERERAVFLMADVGA